MVIKNNLRCVLALSAAVLIAACGSGGDSGTTPPGVTSPPASANPTDPGLFTDGWCPTRAFPNYPHAVSGQVWDANVGVVAGARVGFFVETSRWGSGCSVLADQGGQFVAYLPDSTISVHTNKPGFVQPCAVSRTTVLGDVALQIEVTSVSTLDSLDPPRPQSAHGLSLSGLIFETANGTNTPVVGAQIWVQYYDDIPIATTLTDQRGGYFVCNLPEIVGVYVSKSGYMTDFFVVRPQETPTHDLQMRSVTNAGTAPQYDLVGRIESVSVGSRTVTLFGIEFTVDAVLLPGFNVDLGTLSVGQRIHILTNENRAIHGIERVDRDWFPGMSDALIGGRFADLAPPAQFALRGVGDWVVDVSATTFFGYHWLGDPGWPGECGGIPVSADRFWQLAASPQPSGPATVSTWGRFEGGVFHASSVYICFQAPPT